MKLNLTTKVAGVTFNDRQLIIQQMTGQEPVRIVPEPENKYDPNALAVHVALASGQIAHVGYIPRDLAENIAPLLEGELIMVKLKEITGGYAPGISFGLLLEIVLEDRLERAIPSQKRSMFALDELDPIADLDDDDTYGPDDDAYSGEEGDPRNYDD